MRKPKMSKKQFKALDVMRIKRREEFEQQSDDVQQDFWKAMWYYDMIPWMAKNGVRFSEQGEY